MELTFLGTGTSHGVPVIKCKCSVCKSTDQKDKRFRSSVYFTSNNGTNILIDTGQDFRQQAIIHDIEKIDAVLLTHHHADHLFGIDDLRVFSCSGPHKENANSEKYDAPAIPIYMNQIAANYIQDAFSYMFMNKKEGGGTAKISINVPTQSFVIDDVKITPIPMMHGSLATYGWVLNNLAYLTDCNFISQQSFELINKTCSCLEYLIIDGLRVKEHSTHFNLSQAMEAANKINCKNVYFTHLTHNHSHKEVNDFINENLSKFENLQKIKAEGGVVEAAYDGLKLSF
ncbi:MAG: MBL fold metallo-hydrolase [Treponema sp.]|nr:MBL fold metallo-hydrolase [Treponema sp.]